MRSVTIRLGEPDVLAPRVIDSLEGFMNGPHLFSLSELSVIDLVGDDAVKIAQNLTTNDLAPLAVGSGCETFVTDVRGKTLGHFVVFRTDEGLRFIGAAGQSQTLASHADRYTIREDSEAHVRDEELVGVVLDGEAAGHVDARFAAERGEHRYRHAESGIDGVIGIYEVPWLGNATRLLLVERLAIDDVLARLAEGAFVGEAGDEGAFHERRTRVGFPWYGVDLDEKNLPQEAARDAEAICFTKGCYLGQETVARLDALGQVQKKLVHWSLDRVPSAGSTLTSGGKTVGRLTSVSAADGGGSIALGFARRSHFDPGATAEGVDAVDGETFRGEVMTGGT